MVEWIRKMWYTYTVEYYSATKKKWCHVICEKISGTGEHHIK